MNIQGRRKHEVFEMLSNICNLRGSDRVKNLLIKKEGAQCVKMVWTCGEDRRRRDWLRKYIG